MSSYSFSFLFVQCVAPSLIYYILFELRTECRIINFLLCCSEVLFALSLERFASVCGGLFLRCFLEVKENYSCHFTDGTLWLEEE